MGNWKLDFEDGYYRIFDSSKLITGYFDPDYGNLSSSENPEDVILSKIKNHDKISGGMIMIPLVKFKLFDTDLNTDLSNVQQNVSRVSGHLQKWEIFLSKIILDDIIDFLIEILIHRPGCHRKPDKGHSPRFARYPGPHPVLAHRRGR